MSEESRRHSTRITLQTADKGGTAHRYTLRALSNTSDFSKICFNLIFLDFFFVGGGGGYVFSWFNCLDTVFFFFLQFFFFCFSRLIFSGFCLLKKK